jgi:hypothetical protein
MRNNLTPIERTKREMKIMTWVLSILVILIVTAIIFFISYL